MVSLVAVAFTRRALAAAAYALLGVPRPVVFPLGVSIACDGRRIRANLIAVERDIPNGRWVALRPGVYALEVDDGRAPADTSVAAS